MKSIFNFLKVTLLAVLVMMVTSCGGAEERKAKYLERGKAYLLEENFNKAKIEFKNVLQIDPKFADAYFYLGQVDEKKREYGKALRKYKKAIAADEQHSRAKVKLAKIYVLIGTEEFISKAKKLLEEVELVDPSNSEADLISATIEYKVGDKSKAVVDLEAVVNRDISLVEGVSLLSGIYMTEGKNIKAEKLLSKGVAKNKESIPLRIILSKLHAENKKYDLAEKYLKEVVELDPDKFSLRFGLATFYSTSHQLDKAEQVLRQAIEDDEGDIWRYYALVEFLLTRVGQEKAIEELKLHIKNKPKLYGLQFALVEFYVKLGLKSEAKIILNNIISKKEFDPEGTKARNKLASIFLEEGDAVSSKKYLNQVLKEYPNDNDALLINGKLSLTAFDAVSAINGLRTVVKNDPENSEASLLLSRAHEMNNEPLLAENELKKSIEANPVNDVSHINYVNYLIYKKRYADAISVVEKALTYFKDNYELLDLKLRLFAVNNDEKNVLSVLNLMKRVAPQKHEVYMKRGQYYLIKRQFDLAMAEFEQALEKTHNVYPVLKQITGLYLRQKQSNKAIERLNKRFEANAGDVVSQQLLGEIYLTKKDNVKARSYFKQAISITNSWEMPYVSLAATYVAEKNYPQAIKVYQQAIPLVSNKVKMLMIVAGLYEKSKKYAEASKVYSEILDINVNNKLAANNLASLLLDYGSKDDIQKALDLTKDFEKINQPALLDTLGWAYVKSGNNQKAIEVLTSAVEKAPKVIIFKYHLGTALFNNGEKAKAKAYLQASIDSELMFVGKDAAKELIATY
jgi:tetratricopeptide (TPR) repeat protein